MACGVYEAVRQQGLRVPDDISVVGFDDLSEARWLSPPLTTVRQPLAEMGALAARTVLRLANGGRSTAQVELAAGGSARESTAPPPKREPAGRRRRPPPPRATRVSFPAPRTRAS